MSTSPNPSPSTAVEQQPNAANTPSKKRFSAKRIAAIALSVMLALLLVVDVAGSSYLLNYAIGRSGDGGNRNVKTEASAAVEESLFGIDAAKARQEEADAAFLEEHPPAEVSVSSSDGLSLAGYLYEQDGSALAAATADPTLAREIAANIGGHRWAIVIHGYRGSHLKAVRFAQHYYDRGYTVLSPDLRACGSSEGSYVGMGWLDKDDVQVWIDWILQRDPQAQIVVHGESMGAATTMMLSGEETPSAVKAFVEDCGYTSVWDVFSRELGLRFGLPEFPLLYTASAFSQLKAGYSFEEASALDAVSRCEKPMLFIHGEEDDFIPYEMMGRLYEAKPGTNKASISAPGAKHAQAMFALGDAYWEPVFDFCDQYMD
ncbi:MAG: alpha/beta hydrolase [Coriobacteriales bacterium]